MKSLRVLLAERQLSQKDLSQKTGIAEYTIRKCMDSIPRNVKLATLEKIADALGIKLVIKFEDQ